MKELTRFRQFLAEGQINENMIDVLNHEIAIAREEGEPQEVENALLKAKRAIEGGADIEVTIDELSVELEKLTGDTAGEIKSGLMGYESPN